MSYTTYTSNNSGGGWWLSDDDWVKLEAAGWEVEWVRDEKDRTFLRADKDGRWLGALATTAKRRDLTLKDAVREWESITGQSAAEEGCNCCGPPHGFSFYDDNGKYVAGVDIVRNNSWTIS